MLFFAPIMPDLIFYVTAIYVLAAILPAVFLMRYVYRQDQIESEPVGLLISLVWRGVLAALAAIVLEVIGKTLLDGLVPEDNPKYVYYMAFLVVAAVEEGTKFYFLRRRTWYDSNFNFRFDAIVYAVFVSLGFAAFENVKYVFSYGLSVALPRAILAVPGHMGFAVFMGIFYGRAKHCANWGKDFGYRLNMLLAYLFPVALHGVYDSCCMTGTNRSTAIFVVFVIIMYLVVFRMIKRESQTDTPV